MSFHDGPFRLSRTASSTPRTCRCPQIAAAVGTPVYVYSHRDDLTRHARVFLDAVADVESTAARSTLVAFAVKSNPNLRGSEAILAKLRPTVPTWCRAASCCARVRRGFRPHRHRLFRRRQGPREEMALALRRGRHFPVQSSRSEPEEGNELSAHRGPPLGTTAPICAFRINPERRSRSTHAKISTGKLRQTNSASLMIARMAGIYARRSRTGRASTMRGVAVHIGSQLTNLDPSRAAFEKVGAN